MKSPELQELTGSEPLTLDEEHAMQKTWHADQLKCTFIVLDKEILTTTQDEVSAMVGDTNLFISDDESEGKMAEAEIMIAELKARGRKLGWQAMIAMMRYGAEYLHIQKYEAKIKMDNMPSIKMFQKIGFVEVSKSEVFREVTLELPITQDCRAWLENNSPWSIEHYTPK